MVAMQSILYTCAFTLSWTGPTVFHLAGWIGGYKSFFGALIIALFTPLQGMFNAIIYGRPTYLRVRRKFPDGTRWQAFQRVFFTADPFLAPTSTSTTGVPSGISGVSGAFGGNGVNGKGRRNDSNRSIIVPMTDDSMGPSSSRSLVKFTIPGTHEEEEDISEKVEEEAIAEQEDVGALNGVHSLEMLQK
jgi:hypothetical protein